MSIGSYRSLSIPGIAKRRGAVLRPTLNLNFVAGALPDLVTFSRASNATMFDSLGRLVWAPANMYLGSRNYATANWPVSAAVRTLAGIAGPSGVAGTPILLVVDNGQVTTGGDSLGSINQAPSIVAGSRYFASFYAKTAGFNLRLREGTATGTQVTVNLTTGIVTGSGAAFTVTATAVEGGWFRITATRQMGGAESIVRVTVKTEETGDGVNGIYLQAPQLEYAGADSPKTFEPTAETAYYGPRFDYDPVTLAARGLLIEEARTNVITNSDPASAAWGILTGTPTKTPDIGLGPDGLTQGVRYNFPASGGAFSFAHITTVSIGNPWTGSIWARNRSGSVGIRVARAGGGTFEGTEVVIPAGSDWTRIASTHTFANAQTGVRIDIIASSAGASVELWQGQLEAGATVSTLIPTFGAAATRGAENVDITGLLTDSYNPAGTTMYAEYMKPQFPPPSTGSSFGFFGTAADHVNLVFGFGSPNTFRADVIVGSAPQAQTTVATLTAGTVYKFATRIAPNNFISAQNGTLGSPDTSGTTPAVLASQAFLGRTNGSLSYLNGYLRKFNVYSAALPDAQLQALTS